MSLVIHERLEHVALLTLNRPEARNALSSALIEELRAEIATLAGDSRLRCLVLTGAGDKAFCAGADLKERLGLTSEELTDHTRRINELCDAVAEFPVPVIVAIRGFALAGGAELAVAADIRVMSNDGSFGLPEVHIGVFPGAGATIRLPRLIGMGHASDLLFTGRRVGAAEALRLGLANRVVPSEEVLPTALELADEIAKGAPLAIQALKAALHQTAGLPPTEAARIVSRLRAPLDATDDYAEGLKAFSERRSPRFQGM